MNATLTVHKSNGPARVSGDSPAIVIILKKSQGSVWSEAGRTPLCPTLGWLRATYGNGQYELRLKQGNRILCMANADCKPPVLDLNESRTASGNERARVGIGLRGTALG